MNESMNSWDTPISSILHLANPEVHFLGGHLHLVLEDLDTTEKWKLEVRDVIGYRFTQHFGMKRLANTFIITESAWISALHQEPMFIPGQLDGVRHYLIATTYEDFEVLTKEEPSISKNRGVQATHWK